MTEYDNRSITDVARRGLDRLTGRDRPGRGKLHFVFRVNGRRIGYCYIRKNACSAFKRLIVDHSEHRDLCPPSGNPIDFMSMYHAEMSPAALSKCDATVFVYRDPIKRLSSVFVNKFIVRSGHEDIFASYRRVTGKPPEQATYRDFVADYVGIAPQTRDPHVWPQYDHLHNIRYSHGVNIADLVEEISGILGEEKARFYFSSRVNASDGRFDDSVSDFSDRPADELHALYLLHGILPRHEQLAPQPAVAAISTVYARDLALYGTLAQARARRKASGLASA